MERGFKTDAERIATQVREELSLGVRDALRPLDLAAHLAIPVYTLGTVSRNCTRPGVLACFHAAEADCFSAVTIFRGFRRIIVHNENHHPHRQASNLAHELSHCLLSHDPEDLVQRDGQRYWNAELEGEANWLAGALLVPREGGLILLRAGWEIVDIAANYAVSEVLCRWRINATGVPQQLARAHRFSR